jgi:hypothetical protein
MGLKELSDLCDAKGWIRPRYATHPPPLFACCAFAYSFLLFFLAIPLSLPV